ncbi:MAG: hypothetical protein EOM66_01520 [Clostridia bacterium]|nr:hypothetical protein [Clostridia bacterium]
MEKNGFTVLNANETQAPKRTCSAATRQDGAHTVRFIETIDHDYAKYNIGDQIKALGIPEQTDVFKGKKTGRLWVAYRIFYCGRFCAATRINDTILIADGPKNFSVKLWSYFKNSGIRDKNYRGQYESCAYGRRIFLWGRIKNLILWGMAFSNAAGNPHNGG